MMAVAARVLLVDHGISAGNAPLDCGLLADVCAARIC
jgi:hypothetical protein